MDGQEQETAGKRKTKNSTSLAKGEKDLVRAKKESENQIIIFYDGKNHNLFMIEFFFH